MGSHSHDIGITNYLRYNDIVQRFTSVADFTHRGISTLEKGATIDVSLVGKTLSASDLTLLDTALKNYKVTRLDLSFCDLDDTKAVAVARILSAHPEIKVLGLRKNRFSDGGVEAVTREQKAGAEIDWKENEIGVDGACMIAREAVHSQRKRLDLTDNKLGDRGAIEIASILRNGRGKISEVVLVGNDIGIEGDKALALDLVPQGVTVTHRSKRVSLAKQYPKVSAIVILALAIFFPPTVFVTVPIALLCKIRIAKKGCEYEPKVVIRNGQRVLV